MKVGSKIALLTIIMIAALCATAIFVYVESFELQNSLPKINDSIKEVQSAYNSTIQIENLSATLSNVLSTLEFNISNNSTSILKSQNDLFDNSVEKAILMAGQIPSSNEASQVLYNLKKLKNTGDLAFAQGATLVNYQGHFNIIQSNLSNAKDEYTQIESQISALMTLNKTTVSTIESNFITIAASANDLYSLPATKSQLVQTKLDSQIAALPINELNIADTENLLDNVAILIGTSEAQNMVSSMKLALKNIYIATSDNMVDTQLILMQTFIQSFKTDINMGALNPVGIFYANRLLDRYYTLSQQLGSLVMKAQDYLLEIQSISASADNYNKQISSQRDLITNLITVDAKKYFNSINSSLSSLLDKANANTQNALSNLHISSDPISKGFNYLVTITLIIVVISIVCLIVLAIFLIFDFKRNLKNLETFANGTKDLSVNTQETNRKDEFGNIQRSLHKMNDYLKENVANLKQTISSMKSDLQNIDSMEDKSLSGITEAIANVDKLKSSAKDSAEELKEIIMNLSKIVESERSAMSKMEIPDKSYQEKAFSDAQKEIDNLASELSAFKDEIIKKSKYVEDLKASYTSISNIAEALDSIARQSNILALNVAIKSAKSGSDEYGFLESEIKTISNESVRISKEIKAEMKTLNDKIEQGISEVESYTESIKHLFDSQGKLIETVKHLNVIFDGTMKDVKEMSEMVKLNDSQELQHYQILQEKIKLLEETISSLDSISRSLNESKNVMVDISDLTKKIESTSEILDENVKKFKTE